MKLIKVKFIKPGNEVQMAHCIGDKVEMPELLALELSERGIIEPFNPTKEPQLDLPENLPARDLILAAGITTVEEVLLEIKGKTLTEIKGIGKRTAEQIEEFLTK